MQSMCHEGGIFPPAHTNAFIDLNGIPYLLAEYLDRRNFLQTDRSLIRSEVSVDLNDAMRAIVNISVDQIGKRTDGLPDVTGNNTKLKQLIQMIHDNNLRLDHQFDVIRPGLVVRVNYQLENQRTGHIIRTMAEDLRIKDRAFFLDVNPRNINDNAVIVNFNDTLVSTINEFTHGTDPMMMRITTVQLYYEGVRRHPMMPMGVHSQTWPSRMPGNHASENELYWYHREQQEHLDPWGNSHQRDVIPPDWVAFNRYYHFDNAGHDMVLHLNEINDPHTSSVMLSCGMVHVNRAFLINPGHRIIFRLSIWKNDLTVANDCLPMARAIKAPIDDPYFYCGECHPHREPCCPGWDRPAYDDFRHPPEVTRCPDPYPPHYHHHDVYPDMEKIISLYNQSKAMDYEQNDVINQMTDLLNQMMTKLGMNPEDAKIPVLPGTPSSVPSTPIQPGRPLSKMDQLMLLMKAIQDQITALQKGDGDNCDCPDIVPIPDETIKDVISAAEEELGKKPTAPTNPDKKDPDPGQKDPDPSPTTPDPITPTEGEGTTTETTGDEKTPEGTSGETTTDPIYDLND